MGSQSGQGTPVPSSGSPASFATTRWSLVIAAGGGGEAADPGTALAELCRLYWYPLYAYVRRRGYGADEAGDLTQGFFARLLERHIVGTADPQRGRFRAYLLGALKHFLSDERDAARALKRGGGCVTTSRDLEAAEGRYLLEPVDELTPDRLFDRRWALTLIGLVMAELRRQYAAEGKGALFDRFKGFLVSGAADATQAEVAAGLGMTPGAARVALHRIRRRYRELLREQIAQTVASPDQIESEIRDLFDALRR